ncbi:serine/threonine-protein kinase [Thermomonospora cellulosilytica]|uniref:non-specific serine/threonine protein kinase n=1 Tax=Thermomonospora cellulosilytica TaxID=1411118 RepID=A0A7W3MWY1_9ACTN|nr:serine/threonine-protein kinase [Thermomonospora cellulosilytica]MBA9003337.1 serine/threonine protein kinase [Thermomonospora cellulosilytica]
MSIPSSVGRYRIERVLGSGAFAAVWLGHDDALEAPVAIKVLSGSLLDDLDVRNRFLEEARILRRADSERLVRVHDIGELPDGRPYFVMSYADRGTLADRMRQRPLDVPTALALAEEIARGVQVINRLGVIHRDLKPSNVLFQSTPDGGERLLIADLGLAKAIAHASGAFTLPVGTPGYMSPEQARFGGGLDVRADVYGLGALTYHMVTGKAPGPAPVKKRPSELRAELTPEFDQVILRAMEVDRERRYPTAEAFAEALASLRASVTSGGPAQSAQNAPSQRGGRPGGARPSRDRAPSEPVEPEPPTTPDVHPARRRAAQAQGPQGPQGPQDARPGEPDERSTAQLPMPEAGRRPQPPAGDQTVVDPPQGGFRTAGPEEPGEDRTIAISRDQFPPGPQPPRPQAPPPGPGPAAGHGTPFPGPAPQPPNGQNKGRGRWIALATGAGIVAVALVGGLLLGQIGSDDEPDGPATPTLPADFTAVADPSGKIRASVPRAWARLPQPTTWQPSTVGLADAQARPVLRATPGTFQQFLDSAAKTPGVFIGLTTDVAQGKLPPPTFSEHEQCTKGRPENYTAPDRSLSGTVTRYTACRTGTPSITEVGLVDRNRRFGLWIRVKEVDGRKVTDDILRTLKVTGP